MSFQGGTLKKSKSLKRRSKPKSRYTYLKKISKSSTKGSRLRSKSILKGLEKLVSEFNDIASKYSDDYGGQDSETFQTLQSIVEGKSPVWLESGENGWQLINNPPEIAGLELSKSANKIMAYLRKYNSNFYIKEYLKQNYNLRYA
jgi:hypothetical protein